MVVRRNVTRATSGPDSASLNATSGMGFPATGDPMAVRTTSASPTSGDPNRASWWRAVGDPAPVSKLAVHVTATAGNVCLAVARGAGGRSAADLSRIATTGAVPCPAVGYAEIALDVPVDVSPVTDWFGYSADTATPTFYGEMNSGFGLSPLIAGRAFFNSNDFPLSAVVGGGTNGYISRHVTIIGVA